jgi:hypothetical protein
MTSATFFIAQRHVDKATRRETIDVLVLYILQLHAAT